MAKHSVNRRQKDISRLQRERKDRLAVKLKAEKNKENR